MTRQAHRVSRGRIRLGPATETPMPARIEGTRQMGGAWMPPACPKCHAEPPMWSASAWSGWCRGCGADWYKTTHHYQLPAPKNTQHARPVWLPNVKEA